MSTLDEGALAGRDEDALVVRLRAGDEAAFEELVRTYAGRLFPVARRILGRDDEAADAMQDAFISVFKNIDRFEGGSALGTWLHRIVANAALMRLRKRKRRGEHTIETLLPTFDDTGHRAGARARPSSPADPEEDAELRALLRDKIDELPEDYRDVILLRDVAQVETKEAADVLGISAGAVKTRLHRARQALRTLLEGEVL